MTRSRTRMMLQELLFDERPPARFQQADDSDRQRELASRQPFTALDYAVNVDKRYHPVTFNAVKGSPFEKQYRRQVPGTPE
jgi:hypothetical protein